METRSKFTRISRSRLLILLGTSVGLLFVPAVAMLFSNEVRWGALDFVLAGVLLVGTVLVVEILLRVVTSRRNRILSIGVVLLILVLVWVELAVGVFGSPIAGT